MAGEERVRQNPDRLDDTIEESCSMVHDIVHKVKKRKYGDNTTRELSSQFLENNPETSTAEGHQEVQSPRLHRHRKIKRKKCTMAGECESSETVTVESKNQFVNDDVRTKKKKKREKEINGSRSEGQCNESEVQNLRLADHAEKKEKKKQREKFTSLGGCNSSVKLDTDLVLKNQLVDDEKKQKKQKKEKHFSSSGAACDSLQLQNVRLFGDQRKKKHHPRSVEGDRLSQVCAVQIGEEKQHSKLTGIEDKQKKNKNRHSCLAEEGGIPKFKVKTTKEKDCSIVVKGDDTLEIPAKGTLQSVHNPKFVDVKVRKKKRKHCSNSAEDGDVSEYTPVKIMQQQNSVGKGGNQSKKDHYQSAEGISETITGNSCKESAILESADVGTKTSPKKCKKKKMQCDISINDAEILQKSVKKCKERSVLPFETVMEKNCRANLLENLDKSLKKRKVKLNASVISQNTSTDCSTAPQGTDSAGSVAEQTEQAVHDSTMITQKTGKISKKLKRKKRSLLKCSLLKCKSSKTKKMRQDGPAHYSVLRRESALKVFVTPETIAKPNEILKTRKKQKKKWRQRQREIVSDNNIDKASVEQPQEEGESFDQDIAKGVQISKSKLVELLRDFVPTVGKLTTGTLYSMYKYDLPRFEKFKEEGIPVRQGRFTKEENKQLQKNIKELMELTGIENEWEFFHVPESYDEMMRIKQLKQKNLFCIKLAEGIPRSWKSVYQRAKKMYDPNRCKGRYTEEELEKLNKLQTVHGNHWVKIAKLMDRSDASVINRARLLKKSLNNGPWSKKEVKTLMKIMKKIMKEKIQESLNDPTVTDSDSNLLDSVFRENLYKKLPWSAIAEQMEHRNWLQCRQKWMSILTTKMSGGEMVLKDNSYQNNINLIKRLYLLGVDDIGQVNWEELCSAVGDVPPITIQRMFYKLKNRYVPDWSRKSFGAVVEFLHDDIVPKMEATLCQKSQVEDTYQPQQHMFQLSDIFNEIDNSDIEDEDDEIETIHQLEEHIGTSVQTPFTETN